MALLHTLKYLLILPFLIRLIERLIDKTLGHIIMQIFAINSRTEIYHKEDGRYDYIKAK